MTCSEEHHVRVIARNLTLQPTRDCDIRGQANIYEWPIGIFSSVYGPHVPVCPPYNIWACSRWDDRRSPPGPGLGHQSAHHTALGILEETRMKLTVPAYGLLLDRWYPTDVWVPVPSRWSLRPSAGIPPITDHHPGGRSREQQSLCNVPTPFMSHLMKRGGRWGSCSMVQY